jgi:glycerol-3-phosphate cytidylyltransferase
MVAQGSRQGTRVVQINPKPDPLDAEPERLSKQSKFFTKITRSNMKKSPGDGLMKRIITYGTFDTLHFGHIRLLQRARALGDYLIVGLSTENFNEQKNKIALHSWVERKFFLEALRCVDLVIPETKWDQKIKDITTYEITTFVMGSDWEGRFDELNEICEVIYLQRTPDISSTEIRNLIHSHQTS